MSGNREPIIFKVLKKSEETGGYKKFQSLHSGYSTSPNPTAANETANRISVAGVIKPALFSQPLATPRASMTTPVPSQAAIASRKRSLLDVTRKSLRGNSTGILLNSTSPTTPKRSESVIVNNRTITCLPNDAKRRLSSTSPVPASPTATSKLVTRDVRLSITPTAYFASPPITSSSQKAVVQTTDTNRSIVCVHCGATSKNLATCDSCRREHPKSKELGLPNCPISSLSNFYGNKSSQTAGYADVSPAFRDRTSLSAQWCITAPKSAKAKSTATKAAPPVLTLSSDDEGQDAELDEPNSSENGMSVDDHVGSAPCSVRIVASSSDELPIALPNSQKIDLRIEKDSPSPSNDSSRVDVQCRLRIGSYKMAPKDPMVVDLKCIQLRIPTVLNEEDIVTISIKIDEISKVMTYFGRDLPAMFLDLTPACAVHIRTCLKMDDRAGPYYNPDSDDDLVKRLIVLPEELTESQRNQLLKLCSEMSALRCTTDVFHERISKAMVNRLLIISSPPEARDDLIRLSKKSPPSLKTQRKIVRAPVIRQSLRLQNQRQECVTLATYPLPPVVGGIHVTTEDMRCLEPGEFLNDVIIDFYLKYLFGEILSKEDRNRTHIFSSFFYKRLTNSDMPSENEAGKDLVKSNANKALSMAETRHSRVKNWTRNVNIFQKDFVIIPISENSHWFLVVICFANLVGVVGDEESCPPPSAEHDYESDILEEYLYGDKLNEKAPKEAHGQTRASSQNSISDERGISKRPCILIFDSLRTHSSWSHVFRLLREYLAIEYQHKMHDKLVFSKETIRAGYPNVPQQTNFSDCGIFVLQYVESFFKNPIQNFQTPIRGVDNWFSSELVCKTKRKEIEELILRLHKQQTEASLHDKS